jgi:hypothetical protein
MKFCSLTLAFLWLAAAAAAAAAASGTNRSFVVDDNNDDDDGLPRASRRSFLGSLEHVAVAALDDGPITMPDANGAAANYSVANWTIVNSKGFLLGTYGDVIAEAQDFYGVTTRWGAVCKQATPMGQREAWLAAFEDLWETNDIRYLSAVRSIIDQDRQAVNIAIRAGNPPSDGLLGLPLARFVAVPKAILCALFNVDHFASGTSQCVQAAYRVGHSAALAQARAAASAPSRVLAYDAMTKAYAMNAFADHSLTDLFSAGHLRTPRTKLTEACDSVPSAAMTAMRQHDEDGRNGLAVINARGDRWTAWGDYMLLDPKSARNRALAMEAVHRSRAEVWRAFVEPGSADFFSALELVPSPDPRAKTNNTCALYVVEPTTGTLYVRDPIDALRPFSYCEPNNCTYREFESDKDCFGADLSALTALNAFLWPPKIEWVPCAGAYASHAYGPFSSAVKLSSSASHLSFSFALFFITVLI